MSHWKIIPMLDHRGWIPMNERGVPMPGHRGQDESKCLGCHPLAPLPPLRAPKPYVSLEPVKPPPVTKKKEEKERVRKTRQVRPGSIPQRELVALALVELWTAKMGPVSEEDLVVQAWKMDPKGFGMGTKWTLYPSDKRVLSKICGDDGIIARGWATRVGVKLYVPTDLGRKIWRSFTELKEAV